MKISILLFAACLGLTGCIGAAVHGGKAVYDQGVIETHESAAEAGDAEAQYKMGEAYCCVTMGPLDFMKDNQKATKWLCRAARQGYGPAQLRLAKIYSGDLIGGGLDVKARLVGMVSTHPSNPALADMWARLAAASNDKHAAEDAKTLTAKLEAAMSADDRGRTDALTANWQSAPCEWDSVFPATPPR